MAIWQVNEGFNLAKSAGVLYFEPFIHDGFRGSLLAQYSYIPVTKKSDFEVWGAAYNKKPLIQSVSLTGFCVQGFFESLSCPHKVLLESSKVDESNRYSIIGVRPTDFFHVKGHSISSKEGERSSTAPFEEFRAYLDGWKPPSMDFKCSLPLTGGALGFFSYEASRFFSPMRFSHLERTEASFYDFGFWFFDELFIYDHKDELLYLCGTGEEYESALGHLEALKGDLECFSLFEPVGETKPAHSLIEGSNFSYEEYLDSIETCRDYIEKGHSYQINLAQKLAFKTEKDPWQIYKALVSINPVSFGAYFSIGEFSVICGSPELLVRKRGSRLSARPIAGTRRLGTDLENEVFQRELEEDAKELAEHAMLVDLVRNDLGKVSRSGSVKIDTYSKIIRYSHVMHIESELSSQIEATCHPLDVIGSMFPGGTVTGVPKLRTMEIIDELEQTERDIYTGSVGYISHDMNLDFNIVIRSLLYKGGALSTHVGGGLTYDCVPRLEYKETMNKVRSQLLALELEV